MNSVSTVIRRSAESTRPTDIWPAVLSRAAVYAELAKLRIASMVLITVAVGYLLGSGGTWNVVSLAGTLLGVALAAVASSVLNQLLEARTDSLMPRTSARPLPAGRVTRGEAAALAAVCVGASALLLVQFANLLALAITLSTVLLYVLVYTPLKRHSTICTAIGAVPGALPPVIGWAAATGRVDAAAIGLFAILLLWQFPHFLAIGWMYRQQYDAAGLKMVPGGGRPKIVGLIALIYALALLPASLWLRELGITGDLYAAAAVLLGVMYIAASAMFLANESRQSARRLLFASLIYLPTLLFVLVFDHWRLLL